MLLQNCDPINIMLWKKSMDFNKNKLLT